MPNPIPASQAPRGVWHLNSRGTRVRVTGPAMPGSYFVDTERGVTTSVPAGYMLTPIEVLPADQLSVQDLIGLARPFLEPQLPGLSTEHLQALAKADTRPWVLDSVAAELERRPKEAPAVVADSPDVAFSAPPEPIDEPEEAAPQDTPDGEPPPIEPAPPMALVDDEPVSTEPEPSPAAEEGAHSHGLVVTGQGEIDVVEEDLLPRDAPTVEALAEAEAARRRAIGQDATAKGDTATVFPSVEVSDITIEAKPKARARGFGPVCGAEGQILASGGIRTHLQPLPSRSRCPGSGQPALDAPPSPDEAPAPEVEEAPPLEAAPVVAPTTDAQVIAWLSQAHAHIEESSGSVEGVMELIDDALEAREALRPHLRPALDVLEEGRASLTDAAWDGIARHIREALANLQPQAVTPPEAEPVAEAPAPSAFDVPFGSRWGLSLPPKPPAPLPSESRAPTPPPSRATEIQALLAELSGHVPALVAAGKLTRRLRALGVQVAITDLLPPSAE